MKIKSILNNSALVAFNEKGDEFVVIGKGIAFQKHPGDFVDETKIEKKFEDSSSTQSELLELLNSVPEKYFEITNTIIRYANKKLKKEMAAGIYVTLLDHINSAIERYNEHIQLDFGMLQELELLYPKEFEIASWAVDYINANLNLELPIDESGFIAIHIIANSHDFKNVTIAKKVLKITQDVANLVDNYFADEIDKESIHYSRFLTHLKYLAIRYLNHELIEENTDNIFVLNQKIVTETQDVISSINECLKIKYKQELSDYEKKYLIIHISRLINLQ